MGQADLLDLRSLIHVGQLDVEATRLSSFGFSSAWSSHVGQAEAPSSNFTGRFLKNPGETNLRHRESSPKRVTNLKSGYTLEI